MPITELGCCTIKSGLDVMNESTKEGQLLSGAWTAVSKAPTGPYNVYYGVEVENPSEVWAFFDFDSVEGHTNFAKTHGAEAVKDLPQVLSHSEFGSKHVDFAPYPPTALLAPVTEILLAYFPSDISPETKAAATANWKQFVDNALHKCKDVTAVNYGWGVENDFPIRGVEDGQKGSVLVALIGWPSIDAHMEFRETEEFKQNIGLLPSMEGVLKMTMFHVHCRHLKNTVRQS
ncbi:hypothetical protein HDV00_001676 [Rhizophlyctis rosea]|nr:hypothetical protein HDV00_001676 [Rhizophlyctis rosea]